jgi:hypothetical protein
MVPWTTPLESISFSADSLSLYTKKGAPGLSGLEPHRAPFRRMRSPLSGWVASKHFSSSRQLNHISMKLSTRVVKSVDMKKMTVKNMKEPSMVGSCNGEA